MSSTSSRAVATLSLGALFWAGQGAWADLDDKTLINDTPHIPSQCYTKTKDTQGRIHNSCYSCHTRSETPNAVNDDQLQLVFDFAMPAELNPWTNLYWDRSAGVAAISDAAILAYIRESNYFDANGAIIPAQRLATPPAEWDYNDDGRWDGFVPDAWLDFDAEGFDRAPDGTPTGWRAFAYYPFLGTFWPTNGSTDDVLIRLPETFRNTPSGSYDPAVYKTNLAIVEALIREQDISIEPVDEAALGGIDLDRDGVIATATLVKYDWAPRQGRLMWYVGQALAEQRAGRVHLAARLYPEGTEFLHTVRYIDVGEDGANRLAARMKEVRYARKVYWMSYADLDQRMAAELKEKHDFPDRIRTFRGNIESGLGNDQGWLYAAMIEDAEGQLRPQTYEELAYCVGCHGGLGVTTDSSFAFPRRLDAGQFQRGWFHWIQHGLRGIAEPRRRDGTPEYAFYLATNGAGDELRENTEIRERFFDQDLALRPDQLDALRDDIALLLEASPGRALALNKAYRLIVQEQSFIKGRDATIKPAFNVHPFVESGTETGVETPVSAF